MCGLIATTNELTITLPPILNISARGRLRRGHVACIRDHNIDRPDLLRRRCKRLVQSHLVGNISRIEQNLRITALLQLCCSFAEDILAAPSDDDGFGSSFVEIGCDVLADTAAATGDEDDFAGRGVCWVGRVDGWVDGAVDCLGVGFPFPGWGGHGW
jgi:hypothetical protein